MKTPIVLCSFVFSFVMAVGNGRAQCHQLAELNAGSPEGQLLQQASQESDAAKKLALLEQFAGQYPKNEAIGWVYEQMLDSYVKANDADKALAVGEKLEAIPPECVESAQQTLKAAEMKKDPDLVKKWSAKTSELAQKVVASPQPKEQDQVEAWKARVDYAKQVNTYTEYSLYAMALQTQDPKKQAELLEALQQRNPKSEYLAKANGVMFVAYQKAGANDKALALAQQAANAGQANEHAAGAGRRFLEEKGQRKSPHLHRQADRNDQCRGQAGRRGRCGLDQAQEYNSGVGILHERQRLLQSV